MSVFIAVTGPHVSHVQVLQPAQGAPVRPPHSDLPAVPHLPAGAAPVSPRHTAGHDPLHPGDTREVVLHTRGGPRAAASAGVSLLYSERRAAISFGPQGEQAAAPAGQPSAGQAGHDTRVHAGSLHRHLQGMMLPVFGIKTY